MNFYGKVWLVRSEYRKLQTEALSCAFKPLCDLSGKGSEEITDVLRDDGLSGVNLSIAAGVAGLFVDEMTVGDVLLVANRQNPSVLSVVKVTGEYRFDRQNQLHTRRVEFLHEIPREALPKGFRDTVLRTPRMVAKVAVDDVVKSILDRSILDTPAALEVKFPLRPNFSIDFSIPSDFTSKEAQRLAAFVATLYQQEDFK